MRSTFARARGPRPEWPWDDFRGQRHRHGHLWHCWAVSNGWLRTSGWETVTEIMELSVAGVWVTSLHGSLFIVPPLGDLQILSVWTIRHLTSSDITLGYERVGSVSSPPPWMSTLVAILALLANILGFVPCHLIVHFYYKSCQRIKSCFKAIWAISLKTNVCFECLFCLSLTILTGQRCLHWGLVSKLWSLLCLWCRAAVGGKRHTHGGSTARTTVRIMERLKREWSGERETGLAYGRLFLLSDLLTLS